jgi:hypothetical protein
MLAGVQRSEALEWVYVCFLGGGGAWCTPIDVLGKIPRFTLLNPMRA